MNSSWNIGSIGIAGPPLRGPSSTRLVGEPPLSPPVSSGATPIASAQPIEPVSPLAPPMAPGLSSTGIGVPESAPRPATSLESLLMRFRLITSEQLDEALREKRETGKDVGAIVVERGWVNEDQLARLLSYAPAFAATQEAAPAEPEPHADAFESATTPEPETVPVVDASPPEAAAPAEPAPAEPETATFSAGPVISADGEAAKLAPPESPTPPQPALDLVSPLAFEVPPALELVGPEAAVESPAAVALEPLSPAVDASASEAVAALLPAEEPVADAPVAHFGPLAPVEPAVEPVAEPIASDERVESAEARPELVEPLSLPESETQPEPVAVAEPEPAAEPTPEPVAVAEPEPVAVAEPQPVAVAEPAAVEPAPEPVAVAEPAPAPQPQTVRFVEPAAVETIARVFVRLSNGERVEAGSFDDMGAAKARAEEVVAEVSSGDRGWPFFGGRYIRPESIVSVDLDATVVRYA